MTIIQETSAENLQQISGLPSLREESGARFQLENALMSGMSVNHARSVTKPELIDGKLEADMMSSQHRSSKKDAL